MGFYIGVASERLLSRKRLVVLMRYSKKLKKYTIIEEDYKTHRENILEYEHRKCFSHKRNKYLPSLKNKSTIWKP